ncbi:MAG: hypothetical protein GKS06_11940 [Acidobacteria bacterium]|nr:hypothetical protein [Acidobacteriota bacterium]
MLTMVGVGLAMSVTSGVTFWLAKRTQGEGSGHAETPDVSPTPAPRTEPEAKAVAPEPSSKPAEAEPAPAAPVEEPVSAKPEAAVDAPSEDAPAAEPVKAEAAPQTEAAPKADETPAPAKPKPAAAKPKPEEPEPEPEPEPDPETCYGVVIGMDAFEKAALDGEFASDEYMFYLEPEGVMNADLICSRSYPAETVRGGILMTRAARQCKKVYFSDNINPESYELSFPKEFGYVKSLQHYLPESREHAKYPFSKKY